MIGFKPILPFGFNVLYPLGGLFFMAIAISGLLDHSNPKRWGNAAFWGLLAVVFLAGDLLPDAVNGLIAILMAALAGFGQIGKGVAAPDPGRQARSERWGEWLFIPALITPVVALVGTKTAKYLTLNGQPLIDPKQATLVSLVAGILLATATALIMFRAKPTTALTEGRRLLDSVGWAGLLPQLLAALGAVFVAAKVGDVIGNLAVTWLPLDGPLAAVVAYTVGMALFTAIMGNAFAAFPVMTAAIGLPLIVHRFHGDPVIMGAIGMLSGFCGTLTTPMAANFNIVPAALLELPDRNAVIKAQLPTAGLLLLVNTVLMYVLVYRF
ncbi:putative membrane protein [Caulobacter ginsengisoli]|uniref:Membrane protein n=1 Tax=Caulobacter ginsengisoli TaxID=400775 RepID=A0ABU0ITM6_9CAUL|nr:DUF979 domain-containing protein [Caulobacter ginsengisoli]MDQ0464503.1 putative membrane protein [Caulobacter ginsengisoli]